MRPGVRRVTLASAATAILSRPLWRKHPSACPYGQRFWVEMPHPFITRRRLHRVLAPSTGERVLEIGPGTGYYSLDVAKALGSDGRLDLLDLQREMLDHTMRRSRTSFRPKVTRRPCLTSTTASMARTWWPLSARSPISCPFCARSGAC